MNDYFRRITKEAGERKFEIQTHDIQTGDKLPNYGKTIITPETDLQKLNRFLITVSESDVDIKRKVLMLNKFIETLGDN